MDPLYQPFRLLLSQFSENYFIGLSPKEAHEFFYRELCAVYASKPSEFWKTKGDSQYDSIVDFLMDNPRSDLKIECLAAFVRANLQTGHIDLNQNVQAYIGQGEYVQKSRLAMLGRASDNRIFSAVIDSIAKMPPIKLETVIDAQICERIDGGGMTLAGMVAEAQGYDNVEIDSLATRFLKAVNNARAEFSAKIVVDFAKGEPALNLP